MWPFQRGRMQATRSQWDFSTPLLRLSGEDAWTIGHSFEGMQIFGSTGCGKTTSSMAAIVKAFLKAGYGGLLTTIKPGDRAMYEKYLHETGRLDDLMVFGPSEPLRYNPLDAEVKRKDAGAGLTENVVALLSTLLEVRERNSGSNQGEDSGYWKRANLQLMKNCVDLLILAKGSLDVPSLYRLAVSAPASREQLSSDEWKNSSFCFQCLREADGRPKSRIQQADFGLVADFFAFEWANLSERTRSVVLSTFTSMLDVLNRGIVRELLSAPESNVTPEMCQDGRVILIDLPTKVFGEVGVFVQVLWKYCLQKAQERRDVSRNARPVFLVVDESHLLATSSDQLFQTTARSTRTAVIYATQSISNYLAVLGDKAEPEVHSLMGNLNTKVFHQQADVKTNAYAAELIGRSRQFMVNANSSRPTSDLVSSMFGLDPAQYTAGVNEVFEWEVQPTVFGTLRKGGPPAFAADTIVYQGGRQFEASGRPWLPVTFRQHL